MRARRALLVVPVLMLFAAAVSDDETAPYPRHGKFVGQAACLECHETQAATLRQGHHAQVLADAHNQDCETCHGPGRRHADHEDNDPKLISHPRKLGWDSVARICSGCHAEQIRNHGGDVNGFRAAGKTCTSCHSVHVKKQAVPHPATHFGTRAQMPLKAKPVGTRKCLECHPVRDHLLQGSLHKTLSSSHAQDGCETCHGPGSLHVETKGIARLITRPDTARDGMQTCRSCHDKVDPVEFHWKGKRKKLFSQGMTCTTCHQVHRTTPPPPAATSRPASSKSPSSKKKVDADTGELLLQAPNQTLTNRVCMKCHQPAFPILKGTVHESVGKPDTPLDQGCAGCHASALLHANNAGRAYLVDSLHGTTAKHQSQVCATCHDKDQALRHHRVGSHFRKRVGCLQCHSPAAPKHLVRADAEKNCASCHKGVALSFRLPNRHPVDTGHKDPKRLRRMKMGCTHCHDPHSARPKVRNRRLRQDNCVKCHKRYRGPFVFAHQAGRSDGCVACHLPHGSPNKRLLKQPTSQQNCLQCHANFPAFHDQTSGQVFTNCLNCHTQVHGSNHSRFLFR